jgi:Raf kinase inhibitor-like YbhB/YbcL family protein
MCRRSFPGSGDGSVWAAGERTAMLVSLLAAFALFSPQFGSGGSLAGALVWNRDGCSGANRSPALRWTQPPARTKAFALSVYDPDAGPAGWWHWIVYDIPAERRAFASGLPPAISDLKQGVNDFGFTGYGGPCPPPGPAHHYVFTLYALDIAHLATAEQLRGQTFLELIRPHIIDTATLSGVYGR